jgi:hypothetical protein
MPEAAMDGVLATGTLALSALFFVLAGQFPHLAADPGGLALFPRVAAVLTGTASAAILVQALLRNAPRLRGRQWAPNSIADFLKNRRVELATFAFVALLPFAIQALGFVVAIFVFTAAVLAASRVRPLQLALTTILTTAGIYIAYAIVLGAVLPNGYLFQ